MSLRIALFDCPCCGGTSSVPLDAGQRPPARRACPNGGCWRCLGACHEAARRVEVLRLRPETELPTQWSAGPGLVAAQT